MDTVVGFLGEQFRGDFDGLGAEFERLSRVVDSDSDFDSDSSLSESESEAEDELDRQELKKSRQQRDRKTKGKTEEPKHDVDTPFRLRALLLLHRGDRKRAREEVSARARRLRCGTVQRPSMPTPSGVPKDPPRSSNRRERQKLKYRSASSNSPVRSSSPPPARDPSPLISLLSSTSSSLSPISTRSPSLSQDTRHPSSEPLAPSKRKRVQDIKKARRGSGRSGWSCVSCHRMKKGCDRARPICTRCDKQGRECVYPGSPINLAGQSAPSVSRRKRQKTKPRDTVDGEAGGSEREAQDSEVTKITRDARYASSSLSPPPKLKPVKKSIPLAFEKAKRKRHQGTRMAPIDNKLLALLGLPLMPETAEAREMRERREGKEKRRGLDMDVAAQRLAVTQGKGPLDSGIRSSTFATVMRLVAGLPPARMMEVPTRCPAPARAPPVWAQVSFHVVSKLTSVEAGTVRSTAVLPRLPVWNVHVQARTIRLPT